MAVPSDEFRETIERYRRMGDGIISLARRIDHPTHRTPLKVRLDAAARVRSYKPKRCTYCGGKCDTLINGHGPWRSN